VISPDGDGVNLNALMAAQKTLLDPNSLDFPVGEGEHQQAAKKLVQTMQAHGVKPDCHLVSLRPLWSIANRHSRCFWSETTLGDFSQAIDRV